MRTYPKSAEILNRNKEYIPGGVVSVNRAASPEIAFVKASGAYLWDADENQYIDYHAAFAAHILGHSDPYVTEAVERVLRNGSSLFGTGTTALEGELAELVCRSVPCVDTVQFLNSGSEATYQAIRAARAATGRKHIIVMQGGYNGWHNDVLLQSDDSFGAARPACLSGRISISSDQRGHPRGASSSGTPGKF